MTPKYHILIIPSWYPSFPSDINGSFFREQAIALQKKGHKVGVITPAIRSLRDFQGIFKKPYGIKYEKDQGINTYRYHSINHTPKIPFLSKKKWIKLGEKLFKKYIKINGLPDIIHVHSMINAGYLALKLLNQYKIPFVITEHSSAYARKLVSTNKISSLKEVVEKSSKNIAVSGEFKNFLNNIFSTSSWTYIPNIVNDQFLNEKLEKIKKKEFTFINVCFLDRKKRVDILISAFAKIFKGNHSIKLKIGGDGSEKNNLETLVKQLGVDKQVIFLGKLTREQVKREVAKADAFALSSEYETFGVVLIEALALGKPVIATKCGGPESIVSPRVGYLVEKNSVESMARTMLDLFKNYENFKPEEIRRYCIDEFSENAIIKKLENIYENILTNNPIS